NVTPKQVPLPKPNTAILSPSFSSSPTGKPSIQSLTPHLVDTTEGLLLRIREWVSVKAHVLFCLFIACVRACAALLHCDRLAVDCEGVNLSRDGELTLVQIGTPAGDVYLFDVLKLRSSPDSCHVMIATLQSLMADSKILKILHDCRRDAEAL